jgi:WD40 repeat protein
MALSFSPTPAARRDGARPPNLLVLTLCLLSVVFGGFASQSMGAQGLAPIRWIHGGHIAPLYPAALSADGATLVTAGADGTIKIRRTLDGMVLRTIYTDTTENLFALSPDSTKIVTGSRFNLPVRVYRTADGTLLQSWSARSITSLVWSPDGSRVALGLAGQNVIQLVDASNGVLLTTLTGHTDLVSSLAFSPDGTRLASGSNDKTVRVWDTPTGGLLQTFTDTVNYVGRPTFAPDNQTLAYFSTDNTIKLRNTTNGAFLRSFDSGAVTSLTFSPSGNTLASGSENSSVDLWNVADGALLHSANLGPTPNAVSLVAYGPGGSQLLAVGSLSEFTFYNSSDLSVIRSLPSEHTARITAVDVTPDSAHVVSVAEKDLYLHVWNAATGASERLIPNAGARDYLAMAISPDGATFATTDKQGFLRTWRIADGALLLDINIGSPSPIVAWARDGQQIFHASLGGVITIRSASDGSTAGSLAGLPLGVDAIAVSPDGKLLAAAGTEPGIKIWRLSDSTLLPTFVGHTDVVNALAFSPNSAMLLSGSADRSAILWNVANGVKLRTLPDYSSVTNVAFAPDGFSFATTTEEHLVFRRVSDGSVIADVSNEAQHTMPRTLVYAQNNKGIFYGRFDATVAAMANPYPALMARLSSDFNGDGHNDLIFQNQNTNLIVVWFTSVLDVLGGSSISYLPAPGWQVVGTADFNHDDHPDMMLQNRTTGKVVVWYLMGTTVTGGEEITFQPAGGYKVVGVGDFNDDGWADILYQQEGTGQLVIWYMQGARVVGGVSIPQRAAAGFKVVGVGDLNGDGKLNLIFQNQATNQLLVWYMNGSQYVGQGTIDYLPPAPWKVQTVSDINGDGKADLVFQNRDTNQVITWFMDGVTIPGGGAMSLVPLADYKLLGPR